MRSGEIAPPTFADSLAEAKKLLAENPPAAYELFLNAPYTPSSFTNFMSAVQFLHNIPAEVRRDRATIKLKVAVVGNCTLSYLIDALSLALSPRIFVQTYNGDFDQWAVDLLDPESGLAKFGPDVIVLYLSSLGLTNGGTRLESTAVEQLENILRSFASRAQTDIITVLPEPLVECTGGSSEADLWHGQMMQSICLAVENSLAERGLMLNPAPTLLALKGEWAAARYWNSAKVPLHPNACVALGQRLAQMIENLACPRTKAIAVDCDNTLWGGVVGDDGVSALQLSPFDQGAGYLRLQRLLKEAAAKGLILVALSKNDEQNVLEVFDQRAEMILKRDDFSLLKINWRPKSQNLIEAARELNLGIDSFLLIDDSPFERAEVRAALPDILIAELPSDPDEYAAVINRLGVLERLKLSDEDTRRTDLYRQEQARQGALQAVISPEDFLRDLQLEVVAMPVAADNLERVVQLISKTNQFNLTTRRHSKEKIASMASDPDAYVYCYRVADRFGDAGITGVCIACRSGERTFRIDTLLLSCRVIARTVENGVLEHLRGWLVGRNVSILDAEYIPTVKNKLVSELFPRFGFEILSETDKGKHYRQTRLDEAFENPFAKIIETNRRKNR